MCVLVCLFVLSKGMEALQASGKVKSIGVSNFNILQLERLLSKCKVPPAVNQVIIIKIIHLNGCMSSFQLDVIIRSC